MQYIQREKIKLIRVLWIFFECQAAGEKLKVSDPDESAQSEDNFQKILSAAAEEDIVDEP